MPILPMNDRIGWIRLSSLTVIDPISTSECPETNLVSASVTISAPCSSGLKFSGVAQVLSTPTSAP